MENREHMYSRKEAADELNRGEKEVEEAAESLKLAFPLSTKDLEEVEKYIASLEKKNKEKIEFARERDQKKKEREEKDREQIQKYSRSNQERKKKKEEREMESVQINSYVSSASERLRQAAEAIELQDQEDEDTPELDWRTVSVGLTV